MSKHRTILITLACILALTAAPAARARRLTQGATKGTQPAKSQAGQTGDAKFIMEAAQGGMMEVELGRLASERASSDDVRRFGARMVEDHSKANDELKRLAAAKGVTLPAEMSAKERAEAARLARLTGAQFDREYVRMMLKDHKKDVAEFQRQSTKGRDADVRAFAARTLPVLQTHLSMIQEISDGLGKK